MSDRSLSDGRTLPPTPRAPRLSRLALLVVLYAGLVVAAVVWGSLRGHPDVFHYPGRPSRPLAGLAIGVAFGLAIVVLSRVSVHRFEWARALHREFHGLLGPMSRREIFLVAAASSVGEECFFRGAMQPHLGLWLSSALFALPHIGPGLKFLPWTASSFVVGLGLGLLYFLFGDLGGPIAAHFTINLLNLHHITHHELA